MGSPVRQYAASEGVNNILTAAQNAAAADTWNQQCMQAVLLGEDHGDPQDLWRPEELPRFGGYNLPCWVLKSISEKGGPRVVIWSNKAAQRLFGRPRDEQEVLQWWAQLSDNIKPAATGTLRTIYQKVQVERVKIKANMNAGRTLQQNWTGLPKELFIALWEELRKEAMTSFTPIHSYMFSGTGNLLQASFHASEKLKAAGLKDLRDYTLQDLLLLNGFPQAALAKDAIRIICEEKQKHHQITLSNVQPDGKTRHTLYEMWPGRDPVDSLASAMVVSAIDITQQKETELELQSLKNVLQRHNKDLQRKVEDSVVKQAALETERLALQARLKDALQVHMAPRTSLDTSSPIDRTVTLLEGLLEGRDPTTDDILRLRNTLLQGTDLRRVSDLEQQLQGQANLSADASKSLVSMLQDNHRAAKHIALQLGTGSQGGTPRRRSSNVGRRPSGDPSAFTLNHSNSFAPMQAITPHNERLLQDATSNWGFDMLKLDLVTNGHSLSCFSYWLLQQAGLMRQFELPEQKMANCLKAIEKGYQDNPYHNRTHAASVLHMAHMLVRCQGGLKDAKILDPEGILEMSLYLAAVCHDYDHPGLNNDFLVKSHHRLAISHNDRSPLENHHAASSFEILYEHLGPAGKATPNEILDQAGRAAIIELILATDMKAHFGLLARLQGTFQSGGFGSIASRRASEQDPLPSASQPTQEATLSIEGISAENRLLLLQVALKCADVGHLALPTKLHKVWVERLQEEFFLQGDKERDRGMPISALMDRNKASKLSSSQVGFFEVVVLPMFKSLAAVLPGAQVMLNSISENYLMWRSSGEDSKGQDSI